MLVIMFSAKRATLRFMRGQSFFMDLLLFPVAFPVAHMLRSALLSAFVLKSACHVGVVRPVCAKPYLFLENYRTQCLSTMAYKAVERGSKYTDNYRVYFEGPTGTCSPWHDIPLYADKANNIFNMVVEIPRWSHAKMEMNTTGKLNYIKQDVKKGNLRFVANVFPHHGYIWNYGALPQTWEDPSHVDQHTGARGDNDPLDVCEIGDTVHPIGTIIQVKVLGVMAMLDEGETDWKVLVIDVNDPLADQMNDVEDIERLKPGLLKATYDWFVLYKIPDGKPKNSFAFNGEAKNKAFTLEVIEQTASQWKALVGSATNDGGLSIANVSLEDSPCRISQEEADKEVASSAAPGPAAPLPHRVDKIHYVS